MMHRLAALLTAFVFAVGLVIGAPGLAAATHTSPCSGHTVHYGYHSSQDYSGYVFFHYGNHTRYYGGTCGFGNDYHIGSHRHSR